MAPRTSTGDFISLAQLSKAWFELARSCSVFEAELADRIPVVRTQVAGCRIIGRLTVGASPNFWREMFAFVPDGSMRSARFRAARQQQRAALAEYNNRSGDDAYSKFAARLGGCSGPSACRFARALVLIPFVSRSQLYPQRHVGMVQRVEERLSALGNCIVANDYVGLVHTDLDRVRLRAATFRPYLCRWGAIPPLQSICRWP